MKPTIRFAIMSTIVVALMMGLCFMASAQYQTCQPGMPCYQGPQVVQPVESVPGGGLSQPNCPATAMHVRVQSQEGAGAGVPVWTDGGVTYIATNYHVIRNGPPGSELYYRSATVSNGSGQSGEAEVVEVDRQMDVAILRVKQRWQTVQLAVEVPRGVTVGFHGRLVGNRVRRFTATVTGTHTDGSFYAVGERALSGDSGGGVYYDGKLVGIMWGGTVWQGRMQTVFAPVGAVRRLLDRIRGRNTVEVEVGTSVVVPPQQQQCPDCDKQTNCVEKFQQILSRMDTQEGRLVALETRVAKFPAKGERVPRGERGPAGERGPEGPRGPQGERGLPGKDGKDADVNALQVQVNQLQVQLAELRASTPVTWDIVPREE